MSMHMSMSESKVSVIYSSDLVSLLGVFNVVDLTSNQCHSFWSVLDGWRLGQGCYFLFRNATGAPSSVLSLLT